MSTLQHAFFALFSLILSFFGHVPHVVNYIALPIVTRPTATIVVGGDMMFDRTIRTVADKEGGDFLFSCIDPALQQADLTIANLEGPITDAPSVSEGSHVADDHNYTFTFPLSTASLLAAHGIRIVNIGNNHIENFKAAGERSTMAALRAAGVGYFGDTFEQSVATTSVKGVALALVNFNEFAQGSTAEKTIAQIGAAKSDGTLVIVYTHWGVEYATTSSPYIRELAHSFIDAGAEMVIGSHPHVVEEHEVYRGKHIYYSLGNFIFDQYWNDDVRHGLLLSISLTQNGVRDVREIPIVLGHDRRTCLVE